jgi:hypothetical protein
MSAPSLIERIRYAPFHAQLVLSQYGPADLAEQFRTRKPCNETCTVGCVRNDSKLDEWRAQDIPYRPTGRLHVIQPGAAE